MAEIYFSDGQLTIQGDLYAGDDVKWQAFSSTPNLVVQLGEMDVSEAEGLSVLVRWIKNQLTVGIKLQLVEPPQVLVHNLYRVNAYPHAGLMVVNMRTDEAYG